MVDDARQERGAMPQTSQLSVCGMPLVPECQVIYEGCPDSLELFKTCRKNPGHKNFIPVKDFHKMLMPPDQQTDEYWKWFKYQCDRTVRIVVDKVSPVRPKTFPGRDDPYPFSMSKGKKGVRIYGTGFVYEEFAELFPTYRKCPCPSCKESKQPHNKFYQLPIYTATHVICDNFEAANAVFELFFDGEDRSEVKLLYGTPDMIPLDRKRHGTDGCLVKCATHDVSIIERLSLLGSFRFNKLPNPRLLVSHPHGSSKHVSVDCSVFDFVVSTSDPSSLIDPRCLMVCLIPSHRVIAYWLEFPPNANFLFRVSLIIKTITFYPGTIMYFEDMRKCCQSPFLELSYIPEDPHPICRITGDSDTPSGRFSHEEQIDSTHLLKRLFNDMWQDVNRVDFILHDFPSCPGSSGALVPVATAKLTSRPVRTHSGHVGKGTNISDCIPSDKECDLEFIQRYLAGPTVLGQPV